MAGKAVRDIVHEGKKIPRDAKVLALLYATCHDPTIFSDPETHGPLAQLAIHPILV